MKDLKKLSLAALCAVSALLLGGLALLAYQVVLHAPRHYVLHRAADEGKAHWSETEDAEIGGAEELTAAEAIDAPLSEIPAHQLEKLNTLRKEIEDTYGISVRIWNPLVLRERFGVDAETYEPAALEAHLQNLGQWLAKYPPEYIRATGLTRINLFRDWQKHGVSAGGFLLSSQSIGISASEEILHHELFHLADMSDGGMRNDNHDWRRYKFGDAAVQQSREPLQALEDGSYHGDRPFGYVSTYGRESDTDEDQATTAALLLTNYGRLATWAKEEPPLLRSTRYLQRFFYSRSGGKMDERYFEKLANGETFSPLYWEDRTHRNDFVANAGFEPERLLYGQIVRARELAAELRFREAEALLQGAVAVDPERTQYVFELGLLYERQHQFLRAVELYNSALSRQYDPRLCAKLGWNYAKLDLLPEATYHYAKAWDANALNRMEMEEFEQAYARYAESLAAAGRGEEARTAYKIMRRIFGENPAWEEALQHTPLP